VLPLRIRFRRHVRVTLQGAKNVFARFRLGSESIDGFEFASFDTTYIECVVVNPQNELCLISSSRAKLGVTIVEYGRLPQLSFKGDTQF
jgi:hypothetical protein